MKNSINTDILKNKVIIVEDSLTIQKLIKLHINQLNGIDAHYAARYDETQKLLAEININEVLCAVLDFTLPDAPNGEIISLIQHYKIPILILSSRVKSELQDDFSQDYILEYIYKKSIKELEYVANSIKTLYSNQRKIVLVVEDSISYQNALINLLKPLCLPIMTASNGIEALKILKDNTQVKLIITDYNMPQMDGLQLIEKIRFQKNKDEVGIIGLSMDNNKETIINFLKAGANDFINKPPFREELYCRVQNILNVISSIEEIKNMANTDFLTQLYNRRQFFSAGEKLYKTSKSNASLMLVALIDADHFKNINDTYGHDAGDRVLVNIANIFKSIMPKSALIARFGGEEFTCVCNIKSESESEAKTLLEKLRKSIESLRIIHNKKEIKITISIGVNTFYGSSFQEMISKADEAVYKAKSKGRNTIVFYSN